MWEPAEPIAKCAKAAKTMRPSMASAITGHNPCRRWPAVRKGEAGLLYDSDLSPADVVGHCPNGHGPLCNNPSPCARHLTLHDAVIYCTCRRY